MTQFNPEGKDTLTYGEIMDPLVKITDPLDAAKYKEAYVRYLRRHRVSDPFSTAERNIAYYIGHHSKEVQDRVTRLFLR